MSRLAGTAHLAAELSDANHTPCHCQPVILASGNVAFIGYKGEPVRFGLTYCYNRPSELYLWRKCDGAVERVTDEGLERSCIHSLHARTACGHEEAVVFLRAPIGGSHFGGQSVCTYDFASGGSLTTLADGLFCQEIATVDAADIVYYNDVEGCIRSIYTLSIGGQGPIRRLDGSPISGAAVAAAGWSKAVCSSAILDQHGTFLVGEYSSMTSPPQLFLSRSLGLAEPISFSLFGRASTVLAQCSLETAAIHESGGLIVATPPTFAGQLIMMPHGGPNSVVTTSFSLLLAVLLHHGYMVVAVNYAGSIGYGAHGVALLEGAIGRRDVEDMVKALQVVREREPTIAQAFLMGGSHGGYISAFLCGKHPTLFAGCVLRNPVIDLAAMSYATDIPDWCFGQMAMPYDLLAGKRPSSAEEVLRQHHASPSSVVAGVQAPTVVILGERDLRVPPSQGRSWHQWLLSKGVPCRLYAFADAGHALDTPSSEYGSILVILDFFHTLAATREA